jgi:very-short-patch-repair endonuclease
MLRGRRLQAPFYGVRVAAGGADSLIGRCAALAARYPDAAFSHRTAALLHELPLPTDLSRPGSARHAASAVDPGGAQPAREIPITLDVMVPAGRRAPRARALIGHTGLRPSDTQTLSCGLRVVRPPLVWSQLAATLSLIDVVVLGDACLGRGLATTAQLQQMADAERHTRGVRRMRRALPLLDSRAESAMESRLRVLMVLAGLPVPQVNRDVVENGQWLARPDLSYPRLRIAIEYEGDHHRTDRRQWRSDKRRRRLLEGAGWVVVEVTVDDVYRYPDELISRVRRLVASRTL